MLKGKIKKACCAVNRDDTYHFPKQKIEQSSKRSKEGMIFLPGGHFMGTDSQEFLLMEKDLSGK